MKPTRVYLGIALVGVSLLGALWAVHAQEGRPLWVPPSVLPVDDVKDAKKAAPKGQGKKPLPRDRSKADPTLIIPSEVYDAPRPLDSPSGTKANVTEEAPAVVQTGGVAPLPTFPPLPGLESKKEKAPVIPPPLPALDTKPLPIPMPEPTKALIGDMPVKDAPKKSAPLVELPLPTSAALIPPPSVIPEPKKEPDVSPNVVVPLPEPKPSPPLPPIVTVPAVPPPEPRPIEKPRAFVRIESAANNAPSVSPGPANLGPLPILPNPDQRALSEKPTVQVPIPTKIDLEAGGLLNLQTPSVTAEKRGAVELRSGKLETYRIVVRNLGPVAAQQIRIEDELPANAKVVSADPMPILDGNKAIWVLSALGVNQEQVLQITLQTNADTALNPRTSVFVSASAQPATALRPRNDSPALAIQLVGPNQVAVGKPAVFEIRITNQSTQPLTGIVLHGILPEGLNTPEGRRIEGAVDATIAPGETKPIKMPANAVKPGQWTLAVKVTANNGREASATTPIDISAETLFLQQPPATRLLMGRAGDLRVEVTNNTNKPMRNVAVADRLPEGLDFIDASDRGLFQANSRTVHWLIDDLPIGKTKTLIVRVQGTKAGQHSNIILARADGVAEMQATGIVALEGAADLTLRVIDRDYLVEIGKENMYEVRVQNRGNAAATNVKLQVQFPPGLTPKTASGNTKFTIDRQNVVFDTIPSLAPNGQAIVRVSAIARGVGDQRVRFSVISDEVNVPIQREISTRVAE